MTITLNSQNDRTIATLLQHSWTNLVQRYVHLSPTHLRNAVEGVSGYGKARALDPQPKGEATIQDGTVAKSIIGVREEREKVV
ncbi:MAG TPA: hypothetical protein VLA60_14075 [Nitrospirales bacterium]|nr:hypothetical protein [Nitrospirales bacterium]